MTPRVVVGRLSPGTFSWAVMIRSESGSVTLRVSTEVQDCLDLAYRVALVLGVEIEKDTA